MVAVLALALKLVHDSLQPPHHLATAGSHSNTTYSNPDPRGVGLCDTISACFLFSSVPFCMQKNVLISVMHDPFNKDNGDDVCEISRAF
jgi:hypothetical protein